MCEKLSCLPYLGTPLSLSFPRKRVPWEEEFSLLYDIHAGASSIKISSNYNTSQKKTRTLLLLLYLSANCLYFKQQTSESNTEERKLVTV